METEPDFSPTRFLVLDDGSSNSQLLITRCLNMSPPGLKLALIPLDFLCAGISTPGSNINAGTQTPAPYRRGRRADR
jgi:hypothetical protein